MSISDLKVNPDILHDLQTFLELTGRSTCIIFDTETTSLSPSSGQIWEIGGYVVSKTGTREFHKYIKSNQTLEELQNLEPDQMMMRVGSSDISKARFFFGDASGEIGIWSANTLSQMMGYTDARSQNDIESGDLIREEEIIRVIPELGSMKDGDILFVGANVGFDAKFLNKVLQKHAGGRRIAQDDLLDEQALLFDVIPDIQELDATIGQDFNSISEFEQSKHRIGKYNLEKVRKIIVTHDLLQRVLLNLSERSGISISDKEIVAIEQDIERYIERYDLRTTERHEALSDARQTVGIMASLVRIAKAIKLYGTDQGSFVRLIGKLIQSSSASNKREGYDFTDPNSINHIGQVSKSEINLYERLSDAEKERINKKYKKLGDYKESVEDRKKAWEKATKEEQEEFIVYAAKEYSEREIQELEKVNKSLAEEVRRVKALLSTRKEDKKDENTRLKEWWYRTALDGRKAEIKRHLKNGGVNNPEIQKWKKVDPKIYNEIKEIIASLEAENHVTDSVAANLANANQDFRVVLQTINSLDSINQFNKPVLGYKFLSELVSFWKKYDRETFKIVFEKSVKGHLLHNCINILSEYVTLLGNPSLYQDAPDGALNQEEIKRYKKIVSDANKVLSGTNFYEIVDCISSIRGVPKIETVTIGSARIESGGGPSLPSDKKKADGIAKDKIDTFLNGLSGGGKMGLDSKPSQHYSQNHIYHISQTGKGIISYVEVKNNIDGSIAQISTADLDKAPYNGAVGSKYSIVSYYVILDGDRVEVISTTSMSSKILGNKYTDFTNRQRLKILDGEEADPNKLNRSLEQKLRREQEHSMTSKGTFVHQIINIVEDWANGPSEDIGKKSKEDVDKVYQDIIHLRYAKLPAYIKGRLKNEVIGRDGLPGNLPGKSELASWADIRKNLMPGKGGVQTETPIVGVYRDTEGGKVQYIIPGSIDAIIDDKLFDFKNTLWISPDNPNWYLQLKVYQKIYEDNTGKRLTSAQIIALMPKNVSSEFREYVVGKINSDSDFEKIDYDEYTGSKFKKYSGMSHYNEGDIVIYNNQVYECIEDINKPESWNPNHWRLAGSPKSLITPTAKENLPFDMQGEFIDKKTGKKIEDVIRFDGNTLGSWFLQYFKTEKRIAKIINIFGDEKFYTKTYKDFVGKIKYLTESTFKAWVDMYETAQRELVHIKEVFVRAWNDPREMATDRGTITGKDAIRIVFTRFEKRHILDDSTAGKAGALYTEENIYRFFDIIREEIGVKEARNVSEGTMWYHTDTWEERNESKDTNAEREDIRRRITLDSKGLTVEELNKVKAQIKDEIEESFLPTYKKMQDAILQGTNQASIKSWQDQLLDVWKDMFGNDLKGPAGEKLFEIAYSFIEDLISKGNPTMGILSLKDFRKAVLSKNGITEYSLYRQNIVYKTNDIVIHNGRIYVCIAERSNKNIWKPSEWEELSASIDLSLMDRFLLRLTQGDRDTKDTANDAKSAGQVLASEITRFESWEMIEQEKHLNRSGSKDKYKERIIKVIHGLSDETATRLWSSMQFKSEAQKIFDLFKAEIQELYGASPLDKDTENILKQKYLSMLLEAMIEIVYSNIGAPGERRSFSQINSIMHGEFAGEDDYAEVNWSIADIDTGDKRLLDVFMAIYDLIKRNPDDARKVWDTIADQVFRHTKKLAWQTGLYSSITVVADLGELYSSGKLLKIPVDISYMSFDTDIRSGSSNQNEIRLSSLIRLFYERLTSGKSINEYDNWSTWASNKSEVLHDLQYVINAFLKYDKENGTGIGRKCVDWLINSLNMYDEGGIGLMWDDGHTKISLNMDYQKYLKNKQQIIELFNLKKQALNLDDLKANLSAIEEFAKNCKDSDQKEDVLETLKKGYYVLYRGQLLKILLELESIFNNRETDSGVRLSIDRIKDIKDDAALGEFVAYLRKVFDFLKEANFEDDSSYIRLLSEFNKLLEEIQNKDLLSLDRVYLSRGDFVSDETPAGAGDAGAGGGPVELRSGGNLRLNKLEISDLTVNGLKVIGDVKISGSVIQDTGEKIDRSGSGTPFAKKDDVDDSTPKEDPRYIAKGDWKEKSAVYDKAHNEYIVTSTALNEAGEEITRREHHQAFAIERDGETQWAMGDVIDGRTTYSVKPVETNSEDSDKELKEYKDRLTQIYKIENEINELQAKASDKNIRRSAEEKNALKDEIDLLEQKKKVIDDTFYTLDEEGNRVLKNSSLYNDANSAIALDRDIAEADSKAKIKREQEAQRRSKEAETNRARNEQEQEYKRLIQEETTLLKERQKLERQDSLTSRYNVITKRGITDQLAGVDERLDEVRGRIGAFKGRKGTDGFVLDDATMASIEEGQATALADSQRKLRSYKGGALNLWQGMSQAMYNSLQGLTGLGAAYKIIGKVRQSIYEVINYAKELDKTLVNLRIVTGYTADEAHSLMRSYSELGKQLGATTADVAKSANEWLRQGYNINEVNGLITSSMYLSKLGMMSSEEATKSLTSALKGFHIAASDSLDIVDKLTKVDMNAAASAGDIASMLRNYASTATLAGLDLDQAIAMGTTVMDVSQRDSGTVGNAFRTILSRYGNVKAGAYSKMNINSDSESTENINDIEKVLNKLGITMRSSKLEFRDFGSVLDEIAAKWQNLDSVSKNALATAFAGTRQRESFLILMENYDKYQDLLKVSQGAKGTATEKYQAYQESYEASKQRLTASWEEFAHSSNVIKLLTDLTKYTADIVDWMPEIIRWMRRWAAQKVGEALGRRAAGWAGIRDSVSGGLGWLTSKHYDKIMSGGEGDSNGFFKRLGHSFVSGIKGAWSWSKEKYADRFGRTSVPLRERASRFMKGGSRAAGSVSRAEIVRDALVIDDSDARAASAASEGIYYLDRKGNIKHLKSGDKGYARRLKKGAYYTQLDTDAFATKKETLTAGADDVKGMHWATQYKEYNAWYNSKDKKWYTKDASGKKIETTAPTITKDVPDYTKASKAAKAQQFAGYAQVAAAGVQAGIERGVAVGNAMMQDYSSYRYFDENGKLVSAESSDEAASAQKGWNVGMTAAFGSQLGGLLGDIIGNAEAERRDREKRRVQKATQESAKTVSLMTQIDNTLVSIRTSVKDGFNSVEEYNKVRSQVDNMLKDIYSSENTKARQALQKELKDREGYEGSLSQYFNRMLEGTPEERSQAYNYIQAAEAKVAAEEYMSANQAQLDQNLAQRKKTAEGWTSIKNENATKWVSGLAGFGIGAGGGAAAGAAAGALVGSVVPVIGTAIGAIVGAIGGAITGGIIGAVSAVNNEFIKIYDHVNAEFDSVVEATKGGAYEEALARSGDVQQGMIDAIDKIDAELADEASEADKDQLESQKKYYEEMLDKLDGIQTDLKDWIDQTEQFYRETNVKRVEAAVLSGTFEAKGPIAAGTYVNDLTRGQMKTLTNNDLYKLIADELEKSGGLSGMKEMYTYQTNAAGEQEIAGYSSYFKDIANTVIKSNDKLYAIMSGNVYNLREAMSLDDANEDKLGILQNFANALNVTVDELPSLLDKWGDVELGDLLKKPAELRENISTISGLFTSIASASGLTAENVEKIINDFPELIEFLGDEQSLMEGLLKKSDRYREIYAKQTYESIVNSEGYMDLFKNNVKELLGQEGFDELIKNSATFSNATTIKQIEALLVQSASANGLTDEQKAALEQVFKKMTSITIDDSIEREQVNIAIQYQTKLREIAIKNLEEQKNALTQINKQREYQNRLIEAQIALENAQQQKKRVWREGVGWTYEVDQDAVEKAQEELDSLQNEKKIEALELQIVELNAEKEMLDNMSTIKEFEQLEKGYNAWAEATQALSLGLEGTGNALGVSISNLTSAAAILQQIQYKYEHPDIIDVGEEATQEINDTAAKTDATINDLGQSYQNYVDAMNNLKAKEQEFKQQHPDAKEGEWYNSDAFKNAAAAADEQLRLYKEGVSKAKSGGYLTDESEFFTQDAGRRTALTAREEGTKYARQVVINGTRYSIGGLVNKEDTKSGATYKSITEDMHTGGGNSPGAGAKWIPTSSAGTDAIGRKTYNFGQEQGVQHIKEYSGTFDDWVNQHIGQEGIMEGTDGGLEYAFVTSTGEIHELVKAKKGTLGIPSLVNEVGTEAIITPQGTVTTLPSRSGVVPADITRNLWQLGGIAPSLVRALTGNMSGMQFAGAGPVTNDNNNSLNVGVVNMEVRADDSFDAIAFANELKQIVSLNKNNR